MKTLWRKNQENSSDRISHARAPLKEDLNMPPGMYSTIHLLEIMRLSAFKSPLFYPSSQIVIVSFR